MLPTPDRDWLYGSSRKPMACPGLDVVVVAGFLGHGCPGFELYRGEVADRGVAALSVVEDLDVLEHRVGQVEPGAPLLAVHQFDLHARPERL